MSRIIASITRLLTHIDKKEREIISVIRAYDKVNRQNWKRRF